MHDKAFTFQTLRPDTIIDGLFDLGMRVDSGLTPVNQGKLTGKAGSSQRLSNHAR